MKTRLMFLVAALFFTHHISAQKGIHVGVNVNPGLSFITPQHTYGNAEFDTKFNFAWAVGGQLGYNFSHHIGLFTEVNYAKVGGNWDGRDSGTLYDREVDMSFIQIPIMLKYTSKGKSRFYATSGIQVNLLQEATQSYSPAYIEIDSPGFVWAQQEDITDLFVNTTLSIVGAIGTDVMLSDNTYLTLGLRGSYSLEDINESETHTLLRPNQEYEKSAVFFGGAEIGLKYVIAGKSK